MIKEYIIKYDDDERKRDIHGGFPLIEEPQELIRCKDCRFYDPDTQICDNGLDGIFTPEWFCADGKPIIKENGQKL